MQQRTAAPAELEPVPPIAIMDPSNVNQIAVAKEVEERPLRGTPLTYHVHHRGSNASIHNWQRTRYEQGFDEAHPDPQGGDEDDAEQKNAEDDA